MFSVKWRNVFKKASHTLTILIATFACAQAEGLKHFTSDGCSAFPDGTFEQKQIWLTCCQAHDFAYWKGGTYQERVDADEQLHQCVTNVGNPIVANIMLAGVRVGGTPYLPTKFRWGYGWRYPRGYKTLTDKEKLLIESKAKLADENQ